VLLLRDLGLTCGYFCVTVAAIALKALNCGGDTIQAWPQVYLIMELLTGGELLDAVLEKGSYSEADARLCFIQLLRGMAYLHSQYVPCVVVHHHSSELRNMCVKWHSQKWQHSITFVAGVWHTET
jgi:serine/threonine protein kinase